MSAPVKTPRPCGDLYQQRRGNEHHADGGYYASVDGEWDEIDGGGFALPRNWGSPSKRCEGAE